MLRHILPPRTEQASTELRALISLRLVGSIQERSKPFQKRSKPCRLQLSRSVVPHDRAGALVQTHHAFFDPQGAI
jgi:hypothetical protein